MDKFYNPVKIFMGEKSILNIEEILEQVVPTAQNILIVTYDETISFLEDTTKLVTKKVFSYSNPTIDNLYGLYCDTKTLTYDLVIGVGGGSVMDVCKILPCINELSLEGVDDLRVCINEKKTNVPSCPWIGVPTTFGTGSEVTCWATIWDVEKNQKLSIERQDNYAIAAIVDATFGKTIPTAVAVSSALDAVAHATESYWAIARNSISTLYAFRAIELLMQGIEWIDENREIAMEYLAEGSALAGLAFSNTKTTACHSISYPLTMQYQIPHGVAVSMLIGPMITFNKDALEKKEKLAYAFGVNDVFEIEDKIATYLTKFGIKCRLRDWNVPESEILTLAKAGSTKGRIDNNPVMINQGNILEILKSIY